MQITLWRKLQPHLFRLWTDRKGQDLIEYALLASFLTVAVAAFFPRDIAPGISTVFSKIVDSLRATPSI
jgi:Flp pilus assembly pilin Flp